MRSLLPGLALVAACGASSSNAPPDAGAGPAPDAPASPAPDAPPGADAGPVAITFTSQTTDGQAADTTFVAYQDGDGPWQVVAGDAGVYRFQVDHRRYGLLAACERSSHSTIVNVGFFAVSDGTARFGLETCASVAGPEVRIAGTVSHVAEGEQVSISDGAAELSASPGRDWATSAVGGPGVLVGVTQDRAGVVLTPVTYSEGARYDVDFAGAFALAESDVTLDQSDGAFLMVTSYLDGTGGAHRIDDSGFGVPATRYRVVPAGRLGLGLSVLFEDSFAGNGTREIRRAFREPVPQVLTLPPALALPAAPRIVTRTPYEIVEVSVPKRAGSSHYLVGYFTSPGDGTAHIWDLTYSAAWADGTPGADLESRIPDLSALPGWRAGFGLADAGFRSWDVAVFTGPARLVPGAARYGVLGRSTATLQDGDETTKAEVAGDLR